MPIPEMSICAELSLLDSRDPGVLHGRSWGEREKETQESEKEV